MEYIRNMGLSTILMAKDNLFIKRSHSMDNFYEKGKEKYFFQRRMEPSQTATN